MNLIQYLHVTAADVATGAPWATSGQMIADFHVREAHQSPRLMVIGLNRPILDVHCVR
ncbi:hypothetical protein [Rhodovibrio sodomensis]|uniref:hypothetical protein n=1 Tax=Rhodovibrio sodomensis TaxID=1088 RepID=UPI001904CA44|nr:hypothetical protein [Rhodovibrio sodomensis]